MSQPIRAEQGPPMQIKPMPMGAPPRARVMPVPSMPPPMRPPVTPDAMPEPENVAAGDHEGRPWIRVTRSE